MTKNKISFDQKLESKLISSNWKISKNFIYYMIAPLLILLIAIILVCTVGFNLGTDFTGGSTFKLYVNNEAMLGNEEDNLKVYNLENKEDYNEVYNKVKTILNKNGLKIVSYRKSSMDISEYKVYSGQAVEVIFRNKATGDKVVEKNEGLKGQLLSEFNYDDYVNAVSTVDAKVGKNGFNFSMEILAGLAVGLALVIIYMLIRKYRGLTIMMILQVALDILLLFGLLLICRPIVNLNLGIAVIASFVLSILNAFIFIDKLKSNQRNGKFENMSNNDAADLTIKELFVKRVLVYILLLLVTIMFIAIAIPGIREIGIYLVLVLASTFYTSNFVCPAIWATMYRPKKEKSKK